MQAKYLLLFRGVLFETLLLQALYAPEAEAARLWLWFAFALYAAAALVLYWLGKTGRLSEPLALWSFVADIALCSGVLSASAGLSSDYFVAFFLVILSTCFVDNLKFSFLIGGLACAVYGGLAFPGLEAGLQQDYLLRLSLLLVVAFFSAYMVEHARRLARETAEAYEERLAWMDRLSAAGRAVARVLHEVKTPLGTIGLTAENARRLRKPRRADIERALRTIEEEVERVGGIIGDYLDYAKPGELKLKPMSLRDAARKAAEAARLRVKGTPIALDLSLSAEGRVLGSQRHLIQVVSNLLNNAIDAMPLGGTLSLRLEEVDSRVVLQVVDTGVGIEPEKIPRLFEPFAAGVEGPGHGLGLSIARSIVLRHDGELRLESEGPRKGSTATLSLPLLKLT